MLQIAFYKGTRPGLAGHYNRSVRWWTKSEYSHCELIFSGGWAGSASFMDGGVRLKVIDFDPKNWDIVDLPAELEPAAFAWFEEHRGQKYDLWGNVHFVLGPVSDDKRRWSCSESMAAALGWHEPWRYNPGALYAAIITFYRPAPAGLFNGARP